MVAKDLEELLRQLHYQVVGKAATAGKALQDLSLLQPDLLLVDIRLKGDVDGIALVQTLKRQHNYPVIYLTSYGDAATIGRAKTTRPDGYLIKPFSAADVHAAIEIALSHYADNLSTAETERLPVDGGLPPYRLRQIDEYIDAHVEDNIMLTDLATVVGMNLFHFARLFKKTTGLTPHQYVLECKIAQAKRLLTDTSDSVIQVAFACGFKEPSHFTKAFSRVVGCSPSEFRNRLYV